MMAGEEIAEEDLSKDANPCSLHQQRLNNFAKTKRGQSSVVFRQSMLHSVPYRSGTSVDHLRDADRSLEVSQ